MATVAPTAPRPRPTSATVAISRTSTSARNVLANGPERQIALELSSVNGECEVGWQAERHQGDEPGAAEFEHRGKRRTGDQNYCGQN